MERSEQRSTRADLIKEELERLQIELKETVELRKGAEEVNDPELIEECIGTEKRLNDLVAQLSDEVTKLQKPTGAEALRQRLQQLKTSEARARGLLAPSTVPNTVTEGRAAEEVDDPAKTLAGSSGSGNGAILGKVPQARGNGESAPAFANFEASTFGFSEEGAPKSAQVRTLADLEGQQKLQTADSIASNVSKAGSITSMENQPAASQTSFASISENAFGPQAAVLSETKSPKAQLRPTGQPALIPSAGPLQSSGGSAGSTADVGFGEAAFILPAPSQGNGASPRTAPKAASGLGIEVSEQGKSISLRDSFLREEGKPQPREKIPGAPKAQNPAAPKAPTPGAPKSPDGSWQAFDAFEPPGETKKMAPQPKLQEPAAASPGFGESTFGLPEVSSAVSLGQSVPRSATASPSGRSGNPFMDFDERSGAFQGADKPGGVSNVANQISPQQLAAPQQKPEAGTGFDAFETNFGLPAKKPSPLGKSSGTESRPPQAPRGTFGDSFGQDDFGFPLPQPQPAAPPAASPAFGSFEAFGGSGHAPAVKNATGEEFDPFAPAALAAEFPAIRAGPNPVPPRPFQVAGRPGHVPAPHHRHLGEPGAAFVATPSVVIPEADWEAAFSIPKAQQPPHAAGGALAADASEPLIEEVEETEDEILWAPMTDHDRSRCEQAFQVKFGGQEVGLADARDLHARADIQDPAEKVFAVSDLDQDGRLSFTEFLLFMYLLKAIRRGARLPQKLSSQRITQLIGVPVKAPPPKKDPPTSEAAEIHVGTDNLQILLARGYSEEDIKRALFLNADDLPASESWLLEQKAQGNLTQDETARSETGSATRDPATISATAAADASAGEEEGPRILIEIQKALVSYKKPVDRPLFQVSVRDAWGDLVGEPQDTPPCHHERTASLFSANHAVLLPTPLRKLPDGCVIYFELRHWKPKEKKWSTLGWTFAHKESFLKTVDKQPRVRSESQGLHLYEKPLDPRSHFRQNSMRKLKPLGSAPDLFIRVSEAQSAQG